MFDRWFLAGAAPAVEAALASIAPARSGAIAVVTHARLAAALGRAGRPVSLVEPEAAALKRPPVEVTLLDAPPADRSLAALVAVGLGDRDDWEAVLAGWSRWVVDGGGVVLVDRGPAIELSRRALCGGLTALEQRVAGRWIVTSGLVSDLTGGAPAPPG
jgi:hypothetical protein